MAPQLRPRLAGVIVAAVAVTAVVGGCGSADHGPAPVVGSRAVAPAGAVGADPVAGPPSTARAGGPSATGPPANDSIAGPPATDPAGATVNLSGQGTAGPTVAAPTSVSIPAIDVDTRLVRLGRNPDGTVQVPSTFTAAGWYDQGPAPGQVGPAALLGHIDSTAGPAVFYRLGDLHPGDRVLVTSGHEVRTFAVTGSAIFAKTDFPSQAVWGPTPDAELRLITCGGPFNYATHHYVDNIVVFARMVGAPVPTHG